MQNSLDYAGDGEWQNLRLFKTWRPWFNSFLDNSQKRKIAIVILKINFTGGHKEQHRKLYLFEKGK